MTRAFSLRFGSSRPTAARYSVTSRTFAANSFARSAYFRGTFSAIHEVGLGLFSPKLYVRLVPASIVDDGFAIRISWV